MPLSFSPPTLLCLFLLGCSLGYGPPRDQAKVQSAVLLSDDSSCLFTLHDIVYRPATGLRAFPDGGIPKYVRDRHLVGVVDLVAGSTRVLVNEKNRDFLPGHGGFHVIDTEGATALLSQGGQQKGTYEHHLQHVMLDVDNGRARAVDLAGPLAKEGRKLKYAQLVHPDGSLALVTEVLSGTGGQSVVLRDPDGTLRTLAVTDHYYGEHGGELWWYDVADRAGKRTDWRTGNTITERRASFAIPRTDPTHACARTSDRKGLEESRKGPNGWTNTPLPFKIEDVR